MKLREIIQGLQNRADADDIILQDGATDWSLDCLLDEVWDDDREYSDCSDADRIMIHRVKDDGYIDSIAAYRQCVAD